MSGLEKFLLIIDTVFVTLGILVYLSNLKHKSGKIVDYGQSQKTLKIDESALDKPVMLYSQKGSITEGEARITGVQEDVIPVILASISAFSKVPLASINVKSIKRVSE